MREWDGIALCVRVSVARKRVGGVEKVATVEVEKKEETQKMRIKKGGGGKIMPLLG